MAQYTAEDLEKIINKVSLVDYFYYLQSRGQVRFDAKHGKDYYFITDNNKYSVTDNSFYDFKSGKGGKTIKAVMELENKSWKEAVDFLKDFGNVTIDSDLKKEIAEKRKSITNESKGTTKIIRSIVPNNQKLIAYFEERGISKEVLKANTKQIHYEVKGRQYFGIGLENQSQGIEVRNPMMKSKIGKNDITVIEGNTKDKMFVFEGMTDMLSFLQLLKHNNRQNIPNLVCLNSVTNIDKFIEKNKGFNGSIKLILDGDEAGNNATKKILEAFKNVEDVRHFYNINGANNNDLNDYLIKKYPTFTKKNRSNENTTSTTQSRGVSNSEQLGTGTPKQHIRPISATSKSEQTERADNNGRQDLFSENVGNGLERTEKLSTRRGVGGTRKEVTRGVGNGGGTETLGGTRKEGASSLENTTNIPELDTLIQKYKGQKLTNDQVTELVSVTCFVDDNKVVQLHSNLNITDDLKELVNQYKTGGVAKQGRGVLDEYYTNAEIVDTVKNLLDKELKSKEELSILEPSVGTGNFINAVKDLPNAKINTFEINETTAKISKILYPWINVNLRSFESEFITENGTKQSNSTYENKYDVVIGNPPYGQHRGMYKGLGEEPKLSRYEDYFVKRSLDTMKENGTLAMILPSGWLNRQNKLNNAELVNAYRLPVGAFAGTQIGSDIVLLKKDSQKQNIDISKYFEENPNKILGEIREKTNRFGKLEEYVHGNLEEALALIEKDNLQKEKKYYLPTRDKNYNKELAITLLKDLGIDTEKLHPAGYSDKNGVSVYFSHEELLDDVRIRVSDHGISNHNRMENNLCFSFDKKGLTAKGTIFFSKKEINEKLLKNYPNQIKVNYGLENKQKNLKKWNKELQSLVGEKNVSLDDIKANKTYQAILKDSFGGVMYNEDNKTKYDEKEIVELSELWDKLKQTEKESAGGIVKGVVAFAKEIKQDVIDKKQNIQPSLFDNLAPTSKSEIAEKEENNNYQQEVIEKTQIALNLLNQKKFKTPAIVKEIDKYKQLITQLSNKENTYTKEKLEEISQKADRIIKSESKEKEVDYQLQTTPKIKKGVLKYQFSKNDDIVNSSLQNNPNLTKEQIEAFDWTEYNGVLNDPNKFRKYANYSQGKWLHDFYYAEGNIYAKLEQLERDKHAIDEPQYQKQKALLKSVLPKSKKLEDIIISPNHEFIHKFDLGQIEKMVWDGTLRKLTPQMVDYTLSDKFKDFISELPSEAFQGSSQWEVCDFVDNRSVTGSDRKRNALVRERRKEVANDLFKKFVDEEMTNAEKERFVKEFNRNYNNIHIPDYSQFPLFSKIHQNFKGSPLKLTEVQKAGIGRLTTKGVGLLAHEVGFGKTLSGILSMHEAMERGSAKRPLIVVPNDSIMKQWIETIYEVIPNAKVNVLGNLGANYDLSDFDNKDNEITLVTYSGFNNIGFSKNITDRLASKFSYISENELKSVKNSERDIQKEIAQKEELKGKMKKGKIYDWEDFGFDHLTFDEVHNANHIVGKVRIEDRGFASDFRNQNQRTSALGINTWMASQYIQENYDGRNVTLLSATPFTNKPLEYYSILSLIANDRLEEKGYFNVNTFFETFMEADNEMEIDAKGEVAYKSNVKRFKNNAIFQQLLGEFIDIKGEEDNPELVRPNRINKEYKVKQNALTKKQYELLSDSFVDNSKGAILTHILNARLVAISPYLSPLYDGKKPTVKEFVENSPKLKETMDLIAQNKKDKASAGQIIYSELAVDEFPKLEKYLIDEVGYNKKEVAIITGNTSKSQRQKIQEDFNSGKIKVLIGSSAIKEGMNLQENTSDLYILSLPYNFTQLRQIEGRVWRQGNKFQNVRINYMLTEDSIDVFMLQKLQAKQSRYLEAMKKDVNILDISDIDTQELKTVLITNPTIRAEIEVKIQEKRLESEKSRLIADASFVLRKIEKVEEIREKIKDYEEKTEWIAQNYAPKSDFHKRNVLNRKASTEKAKKELEIQISKLQKQGIDINATQQNAKLTEEKVKEIDDKIADLSIRKEELIEQYTKEKAERDKMDNHIDFIQERAEENQSLLRKEEPKQEIEFAARKIRGGQR